MAVPFCVPKQSKGDEATSPGSTDQEAAHWQAIAHAMCHALREYYLQSLSTKDGFIAAPGGVLPNGKVKPARK